MEHQIGTTAARMVLDVLASRGHGTTFAQLPAGAFVSPGAHPLPCARADPPEGRLEITMLHTEDSRPAADTGDPEAASWPMAFALALAVIGPFAVGIAIAVLVALAG